MPRQNGRASTPLSRRRTAAGETGHGGDGGAVVLFCALSIFDEIGGIQRFDRRVLEATMAPDGAPVDRLVVISLRDAQPRQMPKGVTFHACGNSRARFVARFVESLWRHRPTVILFDHVNLVRLAVLARCFPPAPPMALFVHGVEVWNDPTFSRAGLFDPEIIRMCVDTVISVSRYTAATMQREYRLAGCDFRLLPNAVNVDPAAPPHPPPRAAGAGRPFTILSVARLAEATKGVWQVIGAVAKLRRSNIEVEYRVVGDGPLRQELAAFARALGVERAVRFEGLVSDTALAEAYREADAFVLTSTTEGFGIVFLEAWRHSLPVICGRLGASPEVVRDGIDGIVVDPQDIGQLCAAIARLIEDGELRRDLAEAGYRRVCRDFNEQAFACTYRGILASMIADRAAPEHRSDPAVADPEPRRILVYRLGSIGDFVVALPCLHALRRRYPAAQVRLLTNSPADSRAAPARLVLEGSGLVDQHATYTLYTRKYRELAEIRREIRAFAPDLTIYLTARGNFFETARDWLFLRWSGARRVIGVPFRRALRQNRPPADDRRLWEPEAERLARCLEALGPIETARPENWDLRLRPAEMARAERLLREEIPDGGTGRLLGVSIGTKQAVKDWGDDNWRTVLAGLELRGFGLVLIGGGDDRARSAAVADCWPGPVVNACGKLLPRESAALLARAELLLCHDSGPMHLAAAVGTPCVAVFSTHKPPGKWYPFGHGHSVLYPPPGSSSIRAITPDQVIAATRHALAARPPPRRGAA